MEARAHNYGSTIVSLVPKTNEDEMKNPIGGWILDT